MSENNLTGPIPSLSGVPLLRILNLSKNQLDGPIPDSISELVHLRTFDISFTDVTGSLPEGMTHLKVLEEIDLQMTKLDIADQQGEHFLINELIRHIAHLFIYLSPLTHFPSLHSTPPQILLKQRQDYLKNCQVYQKFRCKWDRDPTRLLVTESSNVESLAWQPEKYCCPFRSFITITK